MKPRSGSGRIAAGLALTAVLASGCAVDGAAVRGPADLDTGDYAEQQAAELGSATTDLAWRSLRGVRLADHLVFPAQIDPALREFGFPTQPLARPANLAMVATDAETLPVADRFEYGFAVTRSAESGDKSFQHAILKFADDRSATDAVRQLTDRQVNRSDDGDERQRVKRSGLPAGSVMVYENAKVLKKHTTTLTTPVGSYVVYTWAQSTGRAWTEQTVRAAYDQQKPLLEQIGPESTDHDPDPRGLIRATIGADSDDDPLKNIVMGRRGAALLFSDQPAAYAAMTEAGVSQAAVNSSTAYKAASPEQAEAFRDFLVDGAQSDTARKAASPRDLPSARCVSSEETTLLGEGVMQCFVAVGDVVASVNGDTLLDAQQQISAVYTFLQDM